MRAPRLTLPRAPRRWPVAVVLLALLAAQLLVFQFTTLEKFRVLPPSQSHKSLGAFVAAVSRAVPLDWGDGLQALMIVLVCGAILLVELQGQHLSRLLDAALQSDGRALLLLALSSAALVRYYFGRGDLSWAADAAVHIPTAAIAARTLAHGDLPIWTNWLGAGTPYLQFYGPLFFWLAALADLLLADIYLTVKLVTGTAHVASGLALYCFARQVTGSRRAAFLAGLGYVSCFWHTQQVLVMGRYPVSLVYALLPLPYYFLERTLRRGRPWTSVFCGGLVLGLLILTHPGYGYWACVLLALYASVRVGLDRGRAVVDAARSLCLLGLGLLFGAGIAVAMWLERQHTGLAFGIDLSGARDPSWRHLLVWSNFRFWLGGLPEGQVHWYGGYLGLSLLALALLAVVGLRQRRRADRRSACVASLACLGAVAAMILAYRWPLVRDLPLLHAMGSGRYLLFAVFFLALLAGFGTRSLLVLRRRGRAPRRAFTLALLILLVDLGPTTFQQPYLEPDDAHDAMGYPLHLYTPMRDRAAPFLAAGQMPEYRAFWARGNLARFAVVGQLYWHAMTPSCHSLYSGDLLAKWAFIAPLERYISQALAQDWMDGEGTSLPDMVHRALALLNVRYLLVTQLDGSVASMEIAERCPVVVAPALADLGREGATDTSTPPPAATEWMQIVQMMEVDPARMTAARLVVCGDGDLGQDLGTEPALDILTHTVRDQRVDLEVTVSATCFCRLAYAYSPDLEMRVDGALVEPIETADRFMALRLEAGDHHIALAARLSPLRRLLFAASGLVAVAGLVASLREARG